MSLLVDLTLVRVMNLLLNSSQMKTIPSVRYIPRRSSIFQWNKRINRDGCDKWVSVGRSWNVCMCASVDCVWYVLPPWEPAFRCTCPSPWRRGDRHAMPRVPTPPWTIFDTANVNICCVETGCGLLLRAWCKGGCPSPLQRTARRSQYSRKNCRKSLPHKCLWGHLWLKAL